MALYWGDGATEPVSPRRIASGRRGGVSREATTSAGRVHCAGLKPAGDGRAAQLAGHPRCQWWGMVAHTIATCTQCAECRPQLSELGVGDAPSSETLNYHGGFAPSKC